MKKTIFVTGGAGYIGVHTLVCLLDAGHRVLVLDDFSNSSQLALGALKNNWRGCSVRARRCSRYGDLEAPFAECAEKGEPVSCVLHFAALKAVGESVSHPLRYYDVNVTGTLNLLAAMHTAGIRQMVFSSSATVYRPASDLPYTEQHAIGPSNPYGQTKAMVEQILRDHCEANPDFAGIALRYFNPIGAHGSGQIGDQPLGIPNNLSIHNSGCNRQLACVAGFGTDYPTVDGSGVRDYIHVSDLAAGHVKAVDWASENDVRGFHSFNLGTGRGTSVLQLIQTLRQRTESPFPLRSEAVAMETSRRRGRTYLRRIASQMERDALDRRYVSGWLELAAEES